MPTLPYSYPTPILTSFIFPWNLLSSVPLLKTIVQTVLYGKFLDTVWSTSGKYSLRGWM